MIQASGIPQQKILENWDVFCTCLQFASKKRIFSKAADAEAYKENKKNTSAPVSDATVQLGKKLLTPGDPTKLYKKLHVAGRGCGRPIARVFVCVLTTAAQWLWHGVCGHRP